MNPHRHRHIMSTYGAYEMPGVLDAQYHPYTGYGADPTAVQGGIADAARELANKAMCVSTGGSWNDTTKQCTSAKGTTTDPALDLCVQIGGQWDPVKRLCLPPGAPAPAPPPSKGLGVAGWIAVAAGVAGVAWYMSKRKARPNRRRRYS